MSDKVEFEEEKYKIEIPLTTNEELEKVMKSYDSIINEVIETVTHDKDMLYLQAIIKEQHKRIEELKKYDYRNIKIEKEHKISSPSFTAEQLRLMNLGIALYVGIPKILQDDEGEDDTI